MKVSQWFNWTSHSQFWEKSQPVPGLQSSLGPPCKFLLEALQTTQGPKEKVQKDKQRSTKYTHKTKNNLPPITSTATYGPMKLPVIVVTFIWYNPASVVSTSFITSSGTGTSHELPEYLMVFNTIFLAMLLFSTLCQYILIESTEVVVIFAVSFVVPPNPIQIDSSGDIAIDVLPETIWNYKLTRTCLAHLLIIIYYWFINQWLMNLDRVVQTLFSIKTYNHLKCTWN